MLLKVLASCRSLVDQPAKSVFVRKWRERSSYGVMILLQERPDHELLMKGYVYMAHELSGGPAKRGTNPTHADSTTP